MNNISIEATKVTIDTLTARDPDVTEMLQKYGLAIEIDGDEIMLGSADEMVYYKIVKHKNRRRFSLKLIRREGGCQR